MTPTIKATETKVYPEEDYEYTGEYNGREFEAYFEEGMCAMSWVVNAEDFSKEEQDEILSYIREQFW